MITKAIIPVAGYGTRRLPISKAVEKCMMPIGNRPAVDYVVKDAILAGIKDFYFVVNQHDNQIEKYYTENRDLNTYLQNSGNQDYIPYVQPPQGVNFYFVDQDINEKYGTAIPISLAFPYVQPGESVAVLTGNDFIFNHDGSSELAKLIMRTPENTSSALAIEVDSSQTPNYQIVEFNTAGYYYRTVKNPSAQDSPSNYALVNKYIFSYDLLQVIAAYANAQISGEYDMTEPLYQYALTGGIIQIVPTEGYYLDVDNPYSWLYANQIVMKQNR